MFLSPRRESNPQPSDLQWDHWVTRIQMAARRPRCVLVRTCNIRTANTAVSICLYILLIIWVSLNYQAASHFKLVFACMLTGLNIVELASLNMVELPASLNMVGLASLNMVELASLNMVGLAARTWLLTGLFMHVGTYNVLSMAWWTNRLERRCWNHHDKSTAMFIHDRTCCQGMIK